MRSWHCPPNIGDGAILPARSAQPTAAPSSAKVQDTVVPSGTEVLHVYSTGLNGSLPRDLPAEQSAAIVHLRGTYRPSLSQMYADQGNKPASESDLPPPSTAQVNTSSFADVYSMKMGTGVGVKCLLP